MALCALHGPRGALWLLLPADRYPAASTPHIHRFPGLPGWFLSPDEELGVLGHGQQEPRIFQALSPEGPPLSCFPCKAPEKCWEDQLRKTPSEEVLGLPLRE